MAKIILDDRPGYPADTREHAALVDWIYEDFRSRPGNETTTDDIEREVNALLKER